MNLCTELDEIVHARVPRQPLEPCWISRSSVKRQGYVDFLVFFCVRDAAVTRVQYLALSKAAVSVNWQVESVGSVSDVAETVT